jgi:methionine-rich copper-binding protein CopC
VAAEGEGVIVRRVAAVVAASLLILVVSTGVAAAHAKLESVTPSDGSTVADPPRSVVLRFNEPVGSTGAEVVVRSPGGTNVSTGSPQVLDGNVTQPLGAITEAGRYQVEARIVSADGHPVTVTASFSVTHPGRAAGQPAATAATPNDNGSSSGVVIVAMVLVMLVVVALAVVIVRRGPAPPESQ